MLAMKSGRFRLDKVFAALAAMLAIAAAIPSSARAQWSGFAGDAQHSAISHAPVPMQSLNRILWTTPVDLQRDSYQTGYLPIHYGSPLITAANTVIVPVKTGLTGGFSVEALRASDGSQIWSTASDYVLPQHDWMPEFGPVLTPQSRLYYPGAGGTLYYRDQPDSACASADGCGGQVAFFGMKRYLKKPASYDRAVMIDTPLTSDSAGDIYFGFTVLPPPGGRIPRDSHGRKLQSGIAMVTPAGTGQWISAPKAAGNKTMNQVPQNCAPALSADGTRVYVAVSNGLTGYLVALDARTLKPLKPRERMLLIDPVSGSDASISNNASSSPTVGPDGDVYYGVLEGPCCTENDHRGWLLHFDGSLQIEKAPGAFGYDITASVVPTSLVPSYGGSSSYLLMTKYNSYSGYGGYGLNKVAVLDPDATETDPVNGAAVMAEVRTILGPTPNPSGPGVMEWCINSAAVDPLSNSILVNSEDGSLYRWFPSTNVLQQTVYLNSGAAQAYTPTIIGMDGTAYAINGGILYAVGN
jgi:hypothetical protein